MSEPTRHLTPEDVQRVVAPAQGLTDRHDNPGYHEWVIARGHLGEISKVVEEALEAADAAAQGADIMVLVELADLIGAVKSYLAQHHPSIDLADLEKFAGITARAFTSGRRG